MNRFSPFTELTENTSSYLRPAKNIKKRPNLNGRRPIPMAPPYIQRLQRAGLAPDTPGQQRWSHRHRGYFPTSLCGVLVFDSVSRLLLLRRLHPPSLTHTIFHIFVTHPPCHTQNFVTHHLFNTHYLSHTTLLPTIFHTPLCYPPSFTHHFLTHHLFTHNATHHLSHTTLSHTTLSPTILSHTIFVTHNFFTHHLSHTTLSHTTLSHTILSHIIFVTHNFVRHHLSPLCHPPSFTHTIFHTHNFTQHHFSKPEDLMFLNATPLRKSAP